MASTIFYSWQSDLPNSTNRGFIQAALERAAGEIHADDSIEVEPVVDRDTANVPGSPDIAATIFEKIDSCNVFVADVSITNGGTGKRPTPNPNVLIELGYAAKTLTWSRIILIMNTAFGGPDQLPFDLRLKRVATYHMPAENQERAPVRNRLKSGLSEALRHIYSTVAAPQKVALQLPTEDDVSWVSAQRQRAEEQNFLARFRTRMEATSFLSFPRINVSRSQLLEAATSAQIPTFGWSIGIVLNVDEYKPRPVTNGIAAIVQAKRSDEEHSFDYWSLRQDASFYMLQSLFEDQKKQEHLNVDTRIFRTTEVLLYLSRLYSALGVPGEAAAHITFRYTGLRHRFFGSSHLYQLFHEKGPSEENESVANLTCRVHELKANLAENVRMLVSPLFILFDYFEVDESSLVQLVTKFQSGRL